MRERKSYKIVIFTMLMILINYLGRVVAGYFVLPVWFDSFGTVLTAYVCDPFCGAVVGITGNIMYSFTDPVSIIYGLTSIVIGVTVGICARKKLFETVFGTLSSSVIVTLISVVISTPINILSNEGMIGNIWGDGVVSYLLENDVPPVLCTAIGQFYIDFLDKVITLMLLFVTIRLVRFRRRPAAEKVYNDVMMLLVMLVFPAVLLLNEKPVMAAGKPDLNSYIQAVYNSENGLPCGEANDVIQTNDGILWVGTYAGLYRYNGSEFRLMSDYYSIRNVNCLYLDEEGRMWVGTNDNGLSIVINENIVNVVDETKELPANSVRCITKNSEGYYYIGTTSSLHVLSLDGGLHAVTDINEIKYAHSITADSEGNVCAVTNDGKLYLVNKEEIVDSIMQLENQEIYTCCSFDDKGRLYVGTSSGSIIYYDIMGGKLVKSGTINSIGLNNINRIYFSEDGSLYICTDSGIGYVDVFNKIIQVNTGAFNNSVDNMTIDYQGNLWFASSRLGLLKMAQSPFINAYQSAGLENRVVNAVANWQGDLYVGTDTGLDIIAGDMNSRVENELTEQLQDVRIRCLRADSNNNLWICTYGKGLLRVDPSGTVTAYDSMDGSFGDWARVVIELSNGQMLASCDTGIAFFQNNMITGSLMYDDGLSQAMILCMEEMSDGSILCGTDGDGIAVVVDGKITKHLVRSDGLSSDVVLRIVEDRDNGGAFIVTSNGLCYMDSENDIRLLENFPYYNNYDVWKGPDNSLFVLGSAGIYVINGDDLLDGKKEPDAELLDAKRGLNAALTANSWDFMDEDGNLYLSCDTGVYIMNTGDYNVSRRSYRMMISSVLLDNVRHGVMRGETLYISRGTAKIEIFPEVINYSVDDPNVSYYLEGFDSEPTLLSQSELTSIVYTNVPSGEYKFHICVLDNYKEKVLEESVYTIVKENEFYDTRGFRVYMLVVAMLAVAWFTWFIARTQIQRTINFQKKELEFAKDQLRMGNETILAIAKTVDAKDENTSQHSQRVSEYSVMIARELGFSEDECENLRRAALLHDIGKIGIPDRVLNKPGRLTDEEYAIMKSHVTRGADILKDFTLVDHVIEGTLYHHERYDGTGYPQGLAGEDIPLYGRIIGVADAFDAMTANRVYRKQLDFDYVLSELKRCRGTQFDPQMLDIMLKLIEDGKIDVEALYNKSKTTSLKERLVDNPEHDKAENADADNKKNKDAYGNSVNEEKEEKVTEDFGKNKNGEKERKEAQEEENETAAPKKAEKEGRRNSVKEKKNRKKRGSGRK